MSQPIHRVFISGVSEEAATAYLGRALFEALNAQWVAPEQSVALAQEDESAHWLWLYQPPWQLADAAPPEWAAWVAQHQPALRLQRVAGPRLYVVNAARTPVAALAEALDVSAASPTSQAAPAYLGALAALCAGLGATLPVVRQAWELYETLEATAWLPSGMAPEFRASLSVDESALASLLQVVSAGVQAPAKAQAHQATQTALEEAQQREQALQQTARQQEATLQTLRKELQALKEAHQALQESHQSLQETHRAASEEHKEATEENELLLAQLHHVQEELEKHFLEGQQQKQQLDELRQQLATQQQQATQAAAAHEQERNAAAAETAKLTKALTEQKQAAQKAQQAQQTAEKASASDKQALSTAKQQWEARTRENDKAMAALREQVDKLNTTLTNTKTEHTELQEENDLLLAQLHHVQEELERYFLANHEYQTLLANTQPTFLRARQHISRLATHLPAQA